MKQIFLVIIFSSLYTCINAQVTAPPYFDTCQYLRPLEGEWVNINGNDTIRIYLRFHRNFYSDQDTFNSTIDELWGWIEYKQGNTIVVSDYANRLATLPYNLDNLTPGLRCIILSAGIGGHRILPQGYIPCTNPIINLTGFFFDSIRCNSDKTIMATVNIQGTQMTWQLYQPTALLDSVWCTGFTIPRHFTLIKQ